MNNRSEWMPLAIVIGAMVLLNFLNGDFSNFGEWIMRQLLALPGIVVGLSFHEFGHAIVSDRCGDPTPRSQGRVTLNPAAHIDLVGFICLFFAGFGWGQPVEVDPRYYKHRRIDKFLVDIAGVVMNFLVALAGAVILRFIAHGSSAFFMSATGGAVIEIVQQLILINLVLMIFNLIPVPPLDGFGILTQIFNLERYSWYYKVYSYGFYILLALIFFGVTDKILTPGIQAVYTWMFHTIIY